MFGREGVSLSGLLWALAIAWPGSLVLGQLGGSGRGIWSEGGSCPWAMWAEEEFSCRLRPGWDLAKEHHSEDGAYSRLAFLHAGEGQPSSRGREGAVSGLEDDGVSGFPDGSRRGLRLEGQTQGGLGMVGPGPLACYGLGSLGCPVLGRQGSWT